ncbi:DEKNAAC100079 [Brettanomyces naardenensis]|uniref:DEKNAAC100079 n=1 Tax=Brettanomyces naardenensis TaxID=13370 RepID=A0A448YFX5_BRENA|nr:DEKNAAC100079 [Brettanomyces naardenensis]
MTIDNVNAQIVSDLEENRVEDLEHILKPALDVVIKHVKDTDSGEQDIGPTFDDPKELYQILDLDHLDSLFDRSIQRDSKDPAAEIVGVFEKILKNSVNTWHRGFMDKLYASTNPVGVLSDLLLSALNTNVHVFTVSPALTAIERKVAQKYASLFGFSGPKAGGLTFSGGSWSNITSLQLARSLLFPETKVTGNSDKKFAIYTSVHAHYSVDKAAILLGIGAKNVFKIPVNEHGQMIVDLLDSTIEKTINEGYTPLYVNATAGTTVFGSFDPFEEIAEVTKKYHIWFHIDGSWGGNAIFSPTRKAHLKGSNLADSITASPHKMLGVPATCSFLLVPNDRVFTQANSLEAPYLFHNAVAEDENFDLANGTMGCGRRGDALKFYLGWLYYGTSGYAERVDHAYAIGEYFARKISKIDGFSVVGDIPPPCLQVCFQYNPVPSKKLSGPELTKITRYIAKKLHSSGEFLSDFAPNPNDAISGEDNGEFFRVVFNSPNVTSSTIDQLVERIVEFGKDTQA